MAAATSSNGSILGMCCGQFRSQASSVKDDRTLRHGPISGVNQFRQQGFVTLDDLRRTPKLRAALPHVVHDENVGARVLGEIARSDVLPVATIVRESQRLVVERAEKSPRTAAMLDIGLPLGAGRRQIKRTCFSDGSRKIGRNRARPAFALLHAFVLRPRPVTYLLGFDGRLRTQCRMLDVTWLDCLRSRASR